MSTKNKEKTKKKVKGEVAKVEKITLEKDKKKKIKPGIVKEVAERQKKLCEMDRTVIGLATQRVLSGDKKWISIDNGFAKAILAAAEEIEELNVAMQKKKKKDKKVRSDRHDGGTDLPLPRLNDAPAELIEAVKKARFAVLADAGDPFLRFRTTSGYNSEFTKAGDYMDPIDGPDRYEKFLAFAKSEYNDENLLFVGDCANILALKADYPEFIKAYDKMFAKFIRPKTAKKEVNLGGTDRKLLTKLHGKYWRKGKMVPLSKIVKG